MLFHERQFLDSFKKKVARHLIPYLFFGIVTFVYWALIEGRFRGGVPVVPSRMSWRTFFSPVPESVIIRRMLCFGSYPVCLSRSCCSSEPLPSSNQRERSCMIGLLPRRLPRSAFSQSWSCILLVCRLIGSAFLGLLISCPSPDNARLLAQIRLWVPMKRTWPGFGTIFSRLHMKTAIGKKAGSHVR